MMRFRFPLRPLCASLLAAGIALPAAASPSGVVVSQVYGGGGNAGATLKNDFIELFNAGSSPVSLAGWSVQYNSTTGTGTWQKTELTGVVLQPRQYYLVQEAFGTGGTQDLPTPDAIGTIAMGSTGGKVALVSSTAQLAGDKPFSDTIVDLVGFGSANYYEGAGAAPAPSNTTSDQRSAGGCTDTDQNAGDFATGAPVPRSTASPAGTCSGDGPTVRTIMEIQGSGATSPYVGEAVQTSGVVTRVNNNGFFLQDPVGDGDDATSDAIFVFTGAAPSVSVGQLVQFTAVISEFNTGAADNADTAAHPVTELTGVGSLQVLSSGHVIAPKLIALPELVNDDLEHVEGMLVTLTGPLTASQNYFQGRYGQVTLSANGRMQTPTNRFRPGTPEAIALADSNARSRIILDDEDRENEGDFLTAARNATPEVINFMATHGRGLICAPLLEDRCDELQLEMMVQTNSAAYETPFTVSIDLIGHGTTTGISASDRSKTVLALINPDTKPEELGKPGHIFPLKAKNGGVLRRADAGGRARLRGLRR